MNWLRSLWPVAGERSGNDGITGPAGPAIAAELTVKNDASAYGVTVEPAAALAGAWYWRATHVHHLSPGENDGRHHIDVDVIQEVETPGGGRQFRRLSGARVRVTWEGGEQIVTIAGRPEEVGASLPLWREQVCTVEALGLPGAYLPSDRVIGIHTGHPAEGPGNSLFHHSFGITFQSTRAPLRPAGDHPLAHYVLFGPAEQPATRVNLWLAQEYLLAFRPAFGFSPAEAGRAEVVTIIADTSAVEPALAERLAAGGSVVERIAGASEDVTRQLADRVAKGERVATR